MQISLKSFTSSDFNRLIGWINSEEDLVRFAGSIFSFPLSKHQLHIYLKDLRRTPLVVAKDDEIIGHCELNFQNDLPRLSRIFISKEWRNKGIGKIVVSLMLEQIFATTSFTEVDLSVFDWNKNAIACYEKIGFKIQQGPDSSMQVNSKIWYAINMVISKKQFGTQKSEWSLSRINIK